MFTFYIILLRFTSNLSLTEKYSYRPYLTAQHFLYASNVKVFFNV